MTRKDGIVGNPILCKREELPLANFTYSDMIENKRCPWADTCKIDCVGKNGKKKPQPRWIKINGYKTID